MKKLKERDIERHLVKRVKELGGEVRKVKWTGRNSAPDRLVMLPPVVVPQVTFGGPTVLTVFVEPQTVWVELKNPETIQTFPTNAHERAQHREHERMRAMGQRVEVVGTLEQVDALFS